MSDPQHLRLVEALLFASAKPIDEEGLAARLPKDVDVPTVLTDLAAIYAERGVNLVRRGDGWAFRTAGDLGAILAKETIVPRKLPRAAAETLAIVAYHQPVTRAEIEDIRGVSVSQGTLDILFEAGWVNPQGRKEAPGRPMLWGTTPVFLDHFGLKSLEDLPGLEELKASGLLDANPALATYAASANGEMGPDEEPVEPLGDDAPVPAQDVEAHEAEAHDLEARDAASDEAESDDAETHEADEDEPGAIDGNGEEQAADATDETDGEPDDGMDLAESEDVAEEHGSDDGDDDTNGSNGTNGTNGDDGTNGGNGSNGGNGGMHALAEEEELERSALADAMLNTVEVEAAPRGAEEN